ncbi:hypothetical protein DICVIV_01448 [Dictyocaulus viviparus]|uniref:Troponin T family protein n=1 Tax=Dictyocaulus viviparus TaxID=29172 RepID=A0A0D8YCP9_DICVI|nr:hypothetical protein DICVIV_01448 [Dictyocaulus viviparus]
MAIMAAKKRQKTDDEGTLEDYRERRKKEREAEEEELRRMKEKQERRRHEREQEEREMAEKKRLEEEQRRKEEENRRIQQEEEKRRREEEKNKRQQQMIGGNFSSIHGGRNFVIPKKSEKNDKFGNIVQAKQEMGMTKDQQEEAKKAFMIAVRNAIPKASEIPASELKSKIKELHQRVCKLESEKYDMEKRHERQQYDLKELNERSRQVARNAGGKKGVNVSDTDGRHPKNAFPCFPGVPPPPCQFEKIIKKYDNEIQDDDEVEDVEEYN